MSFSSFSTITWNLEGLRRNIFNLKHFTDLYSPDFAFISEPQIFSSDVDLVMQYLRGDYCFSLNSEDKHDQELPLVTSKAHGGTMILWKQKFDPFIDVHPVSTTSFLPIIFNPPNNPASAHICIYLPTAGKEAQFMDELSSLSSVIDDIHLIHPDAPIFLRGDFNVNDKNTNRSALLTHFSLEHDLVQAKVHHPTYHHFLGNGSSDSFLDKLMFSSSLAVQESLVKIICKLSNPLVESHHDILFSSWSLPVILPPDDNDENVVAPKVENSRHRVVWTESGIEAYQELVVPHLQRLQDLWLSSPPTYTCIALLLNATSSVLTSCASSTNRTISLASRSSQQSRRTPKPVRISARKLLCMSKRINVLSQSSNDSDVVAKARADYRKSRIEHRKLCRQFKARDAERRDQSLLSDPKATYANIKLRKRGMARRINKLSVGSKTYSGDNIPDGFFDSISTLKTRNTNSLNTSPYFADFCSTYQNILELCKTGDPIPDISEKASFDILQKMKPSVSDFFSVTPDHYNFAGPAGWKHFHLLLNTLASNVNSTTITEISTVYACILFKGHNKNRSSDKSYRTISTCPVVAKALDIFIRDTFIESWNKNQPETQFQGQGSSHDLAAVLLTETIQHSLYSLKQPLFVLYLDARSAFDVVLAELLVKNLFTINTTGHCLLYLNNRLMNRHTYIDWEGNLMGPICDEQGLEQGGVSASELYKIFSREQLSVAQKSCLGTKLGNLSITAIGQADDTALVSNNLINLFYILELTKIFCSKYNVALSAEKTKLQVFYNRQTSFSMLLSEATNPIKINGKTVPFSSSAEHVGMTRSNVGNGPALLARFSAHKNALAGILHTGIAKNHRGNPASSIRINKLYAIPVLLSGIGPLVLTEAEIATIDQHHKEVLRRLLRLQQKTPRSVVYFLSGCLPGRALVHLRQMSIFGMITRLPDSILNHHARNIFSSVTVSRKSWFHQIRKWCLLYRLPHPLELLSCPPDKVTFKARVKKRVIDYWETLLRAEAASMSSLSSFNPSFMSLVSPHPLWTTAGTSPSKVAMATLQAVMISGRYKTEALTRHWSQNQSGCCLLSSECKEEKEDLNHIIESCPALNHVRAKLFEYSQNYAVVKVENLELRELILNLCNPSSSLFFQYLLDCSCLPPVIHQVQRHGPEVLHHLFTVSRTWLFVIHRERLKLLGRWNLRCPR